MNDGRKGEGMHRRCFASAALAGGASLALSMTGHARAETFSSPGWLNVREFGAKGDGKTLDTDAIQRAIDAVAETKGAVFLPPGIYLSAEVHLRPNVALVGIPSWDYGPPDGGTVIRLADEKASCLVDITNVHGARLDGMALDGQHFGKGIHGIFLNKPDYGKHEDVFHIERCRVARFTGDGVSLSRAWGFYIHHSLLGFNQGDGLKLRGWDGFVIDNTFAGNRGAGFAARDENAAVALTANRIEWNREGLLIRGGDGSNITGNFFDRAGTCAIALFELDGEPCSQMNITGNYLRRSGKNADPSTHESSQLRIENAEGIACVGNFLHLGQDDNDRGVWSPSYGVVYKNLKNCVITNNVLHQGALKQLFVDLGGHGDGVIVKDNPGSLFTPRT
jgi:hypothetical protein